ncbi:serine/threonine-protein phosphatase 2A activator 2 [[Candida] jaroonii]|uniref:Serine/threonine-protein phosphatase 2A activator 2 n=1 Tax=[Candida] jaroonii TaxID=467808 RepID=A0ACA9Y2W7_9ASCO|nr:serine/threonine-protein phosphatase 2A activator 2 [[Candida] jaroonii]
MIPVRRITTEGDLNKWANSETFNELVDFVERLQDSVAGKTNDEAIEVSPAVEKVMKILLRIELIIQENPVLHEKNISRFGKVEFKSFYDQVKSESPTLLNNLTSNEQDVEEISAYLVESWGNRTRIDYGSGHELNFLCFLFCLNQRSIIKPSDYEGVILKVFTKYISIMRILQRNYWLEPAGSHGVWGLDDYHFLPFLFGASQLSTHPYMKPKSIHNDELVDTYYKQYMYFECIHFLNSVKIMPNNQQKLSIRWHSPMLDDISSAKSWLKIKEGMIKMYKAEVLQKLPIIQHFMFGDIIKCPEGISEYSGEEDHDNHAHNTWGDCCGIKIPSAIAASESIKLNKPKPVPFD